MNVSSHHRIDIKCRPAKTPTSHFQITLHHFMKTLRTIPLVLAAVVLVAVASRGLIAQPANSEEDRGALGQYEQLVLSLSKSGQSNTVNQITALVSSMHAEQKMADTGITIGVLNRLRSGHTNEAMTLLETRLDGALIGLDKLPHDDNTEKILELAREYRARFPHQTSNADIDEGVARALNSGAK